MPRSFSIRSQSSGYSSSLLSDTDSQPFWSSTPGFLGKFSRSRCNCVAASAENSLDGLSIGQWQQLAQINKQLLHESTGDLQEKETELKKRRDEIEELNSQLDAARVSTKVPECCKSCGPQAHQTEDDDANSKLEAEKIPDLEDAGPLPVLAGEAETDYVAELDLLHFQKLTLESQIEDQATSISTKDKEIATLTRELGELQKALEGYKSKVSSLEMTKDVLGSRITNAQKDSKTAGQKLEALTAQRHREQEDFRSQLQGKDAEIEALRIKLKELDKDSAGKEVKGDKMCEISP